MNKHILREAVDAALYKDQRDILIEALAPIAAAYPNDPGTSDLYDEQPVSITLGDVRRVWRALNKMGQS